MAAPTRPTDDAPTTPIARAGLDRAVRRSVRALPIIAGAVAVLLVAVAATAFALRGGASPTPPSPTALPTAGPTAPAAPPTAAEVPVGGVLFRFTGSPNGQAKVGADGAVVAVLDDVSTAPGRSNHQLVTYDQRTGARLAVAGPGLPEILDCGATVVQRPDGTSVVLTRYDTSVPANGVQLGAREAHVAARDGRTLQPLWDVVLHAGDSNDQALLVDTVCHSSTPSFFPTADGRFALNRSFDVSRLIDLSTGAMRPAPYAVNVVGNDVVVAVPPPAEPGVDREPELTGPSVVDAVRLVAGDDLRVLSTISDRDLAQALSTVGPPGRPTFDGFISTGSDTRYTGKSLSGDARTLALRDLEQVSLVDLPSGRVRATIPTGSIQNNVASDPSQSPLAIVPGVLGSEDVVLVGVPDPGSGAWTRTSYTAHDLSGRTLWSLPAGAADGVCQIDRGLLLLRGAGVATIDPTTGRQLAVDQQGDCPDVVHGLAVTSSQRTSVSSTADYTVSVLRRP